jgi:tRNA dimethylallyltransferase
MPNPPIIFLSGPTSVGKTSLAMSLASEFSLGLISVDACQVYRGLDIGTAKPAPTILEEYPHALIDIREPCEGFSAGAFCKEALQAIRAALASHQIPVLVGGSMFYFSALTNGLSRSSRVDKRLRYEIEAEGELLGWPRLHKRLVKLQPDVAKDIHPNDRRRIQRALEVYDDPLEALYEKQTQMSVLPRDTRIIRLGLAFSDRSYLHKRIERRVDEMLREGLLSEVEKLLANDVDPNTQALRSLGYRQAYQHLTGQYDYSTMRHRIIFATRQFAKRQLTWMRNTSGTVWFDAADHCLSRSVARYLRTALGNEIQKIQGENDNS